MTGKIFRSSFAVAAAVLLVSAVLLLAVFYEYYGSIQERQLTDELELASVSVEQYGKDYLKQIKTDGYSATRRPQPRRWKTMPGARRCRRR